MVFSSGRVKTAGGCVPESVLLTDGGVTVGVVLFGVSELLLHAAMDKSKVADKKTVAKNFVPFVI